VTSWRWVNLAITQAIHARQLAEHGGRDGVSNLGAVESALARPQNLVAYGEASPDLAALAACYVFGLARNHGFADGNKRTAWVVGRLFLADNGYRLSFDKLEAVRVVEQVAAGEISEQELAAWFRARLSTL
jgi:death-on-curing protein